MSQPRDLHPSIQAGSEAVARGVAAGIVYSRTPAPFNGQPSPYAAGWARTVHHHVKGTTNAPSDGYYFVSTLMGGPSIQWFYAVFVDPATFNIDDWLARFIAEYSVVGLSPETILSSLIHVRQYKHESLDAFATRFRTLAISMPGGWASVKVSVFIGGIFDHGLRTFLLSTKPPSIEDALLLAASYGPLGRSSTNVPFRGRSQGRFRNDRDRADRGRSNRRSSPTVQYMDEANKEPFELYSMGPTSRCAVVLGDRPCIAIIDTGASISAISLSLARSLNLSLLECAVNVATAGGPLVIKRKTPPTLLQLGDLVCPVSFLVIDTHAFDIILGTDFLSRHKIDVSPALRRVVGPTSGAVPLFAAELHPDVSTVLQRFPALTIDVTGTNPSKLPAMTLTLTSKRPTFQYPYRLAHVDKRWLQTHLNELLSNGLIQRSKSPYSSPVHIVPKKGGDGRRMVLDFRRLNAITEVERFPIPRVTDLLDALQGCTIFSTLDLKSGYHQMLLEPSARAKTAFMTDFGHFEWCVVPFGLVNAPATFQRCISSILADVPHATAYMDDIIVYSRTKEEHLKHLEGLFECLSRYNLKLNVAKCHFFASEVKFLGHVVSGSGVRTDSDKTKAIRAIRPPKSKDEVRSFTAMANYYRRFVRNFASLASPLYDLLKKHVHFKWTQVEQHAFDRLKEALCSDPVLAFPDHNRPFIVHTDASDIGTGAVLSQLDSDEVEHPVAFHSMRYSGAQATYSANRKEALAIFRALEHFAPYLRGQKFLLYTDNASAAALLTKRDADPMLARWLDFISQFSFEIKHRAGVTNANADGLSRAPLECADRTEHDLIYFLTHGACPPHFSPYQSRALRDRATHFSFTNGLLMHASGRRVPDATERSALIKEMHEKLGHADLAKTYSALKHDVYWPRMRMDCRSYINGCEACQKVNARPMEDDPWRQFTTPLPFARVAIDLGHYEDQLFIVLVDYATRWVECRFLRSKRPALVVSFLDDVFATHGFPKAIISDNGREFKNAVVDAFCKDHNIQQLFSAPHLPRQNGLAERAVRTIKETLTKLTMSSPSKTIPAALNDCLRAIRMRNNTATQYSPFELTFLRPPLSSAHTAAAPQDLREQACRNVQNTYKSLYRQHSKMPADITVGDQVLVRGPATSPADRWLGPYRVRQISAGRYRLSIPGRTSMSWYARGQLRKFTCGGGESVG